MDDETFSTFDPYDADCDEIGIRARFVGAIDRNNLLIEARRQRLIRLTRFGIDPSVVTNLVAFDVVALQRSRSLLILTARQTSYDGNAVLPPLLE